MTVYLRDPDVTLHLGDCLEVLRSLPDRSVHMCATSPPFYGLRDYGTGEWEGGDSDCDHEPDRTSPSSTLEGGKTTQGMARVMPSPCLRCGARRVDRQIGLEETPDQWVDRLVQVFREVRRVLRDDGTLWVEIGDSYCQGHGGSSTEGNYTMRKSARGEAKEPERRESLRCTFCGWLAPTYTALVEHHQTTPGHKAGDGDYRGRPRGSNYREKGSVRNIIPGYKPKDLLGQPWLLAFALRADGWYLRSEIIWARPNPMPESVTDRPTKSHSTVFLLSKQPRYFYDADAIREKWADHRNGDPGPARTKYEGISASGSQRYDHDTQPQTSGANARSVWNIPTQPTPYAHFATWPRKLVGRMIQAGTSERGKCSECGMPWVRETETNGHKPRDVVQVEQERPDGRTRPRSSGGVPVPIVTTLGWSPSCACDTPPVPCTVLDPFAGSGTTLLVARHHGRHAIGIELNPDYCKIAADRLSQLSLLTQDGAA